MNLCILHKYLRYNILWLIIHSYTIYRHATRSARSAVSRALCSYRYSLPASCKTCETAQLSQAVAILPATPAHSTARAGNPGFLCILHKNKRQKLRNFVQNFIEMWFFGFRPQYIVDFDPFYPIKAQHLVFSPSLHLGRNGVILCLHKAKQHRNTNPLSAACPLRSRAQARKRVPCQVNNAQSKPLTRTARTSPLSAGGSYKPAQHSAHTTAQFIASAFQNRRWRTRAKLKGRYWCTLKIKYRAVRIQLHHRVTVVLPAPAV